MAKLIEVKGVSKNFTVGDSIVHADNAVLAGKVKVLAHLVTVEAVENA